MTVNSRALALAAFLSSGPAVHVGAQAPVSLIGSVRDTSGAPVALARLTGGGQLAFSDSAGIFRFAALPSGAVVVRVRRLGFEPADTLLQLGAAVPDSLHFVMAALPIELTGITASAHVLAEFERHRRGGAGYFFDRAQIEDTRALRLSEVLRRAPGIRVFSDRAGRPQLRVGRTLAGPDCPPDFWVDGMRVQFLQVDDIPLIEIEAVELYHGPATLPPEYNTRFGRPACGTVVIWSREP
jgi:hypothetical protein